MTGPTDAELWQLHTQMPGVHKNPIDFARAVLAKWGTPAPVEVEPVAYVEVSQTDSEVSMTWGPEPAGFDLPSGRHALFTSPQPTQAQAGAVPLSIAEEEQMLAQWDYEMHGDRARYIEAAHGIGIKGGQQ